MWYLLTRLLFIVILIGILLAFLFAVAFGVGFGPDSFIVACFISDNIAVFDSTLSYVGDLGSLDAPTGLDFTATGHVAATDQSSTYTEFDSSGAIIGSFQDVRVGAPLDSKIGANNNVSLLEL